MFLTGVKCNLKENRNDNDEGNEGIIYVAADIFVVASKFK